MKNSSRRNFIKQNSLSGLGLLAMAGVSSCADFNSKPENMTLEDSGSTQKIGEESLEQIHKRYKTELFDRFLPNMDRFIIDYDNGGFMINFDVSAREPVNTNKKTWMQGRGIWVYSFLYNNLDPNPSYLEIARKAIDFILPLRPTDDNFWNDIFSREGKPLTGPGDIYGDLFVAEGLAEYSKATGEKKYLDLAKEIILHCVDRYDQPDYVYTTYAPGDAKIVGTRVLGHWMIFLSLSTQLLQQGPDERFENLSNRCINAILDNHTHPESKILLEVINHDLTIPDNEFGQFSVIGHSIETAAFVLAEAVRRKDAYLYARAKEVFKRHVDIAADDVYGGHFVILTNIDNYDWVSRKSAWCEQEVLIGDLLLLEHSGEKWAENSFVETETYVQEKMVRPDLAFWVFGGDRKLDELSIKSAEHYHTPRYLMRNIMALERMMSREGKLSGLF
ncbi:hypothetical protein F8C76_08450 [Flagellimonas olearia]|uniref:Uncharacterized protein n=1 Tax=Flagellimonas olearia TaxID=552546 RepID=A0A6I1E2M1_9FLAO|nr:AGE family epimerase/isomerase [Allomuricauda olearia]KAB7531507.1 hypothetical protein F8C76_08450 [Allomuricauda olearia]